MVMWRLRNMVGKLCARVIPAGVSRPYRFEDARAYWRHVPKSAGSDPFDSPSMRDWSDEKVVTAFDAELRNAHLKTERRIGFARILESLHGIEKPYILDYGSGAGFNGMEVLANCPGASVTFADINPDNLAVIQRLIRIKGYDERAFTRLVEREDASGLELPYVCDVIISMGVLHHTPHAPEIVKTLTRFLKPGGTFVVMLYNEYYWRDKARMAGRRLNVSTFGVLTDPTVAGQQNPYSDYYDQRRAKRLFAGYELMGLDYLRYSETAILPYYTTFRFCKNH